MELITIDKNFISKALEGNENALQVIQGNITYISFIVKNRIIIRPTLFKKDLPIIKASLEEFFVHPYSQTLEDIVIKIRRTHKLKVPDAIVAATALELKLPLFSNDKILERIDGLNFIHIDFQIP